MKTFIFCTSYFDNKIVYKKRYLKWINYYLDHPLTDDKEIFLIDDGSNLDFVDRDLVNIIQEDQIGNHKYLDKVNLFHFEKRQGREKAANSYGWWRSYMQCIKIAKTYNYDRIIHIESDFYAISKRLTDFYNDYNSGWLAFWCPKYSFPESAMQIICKDQFSNFESFVSKGYDHLLDRQAEHNTPFSHIEKSFIGDRFGERSSVQIPNVDFFGQCQLDTKITREK